MLFQNCQQLCINELDQTKHLGYNATLKCKNYRKYVDGTIKINKNATLLSATNLIGKGDDNTGLRNSQATDQPKSCADENWVKEQNGAKQNRALLKRLLLTRVEMEAIRGKAA